MDAAQDLVEQLKQKILSAQLPPDVAERLTNLINSPGSGAELEKLIVYINLVLSLPFNHTSQDILDLNRAKQILDKNHYGLVEVKNRILEYLSVLILQSRVGRSVTSAPVLLFVGLVGTGKTSLAYSIAEALGRQIIRIPFGGLGDPTQLRGQSRALPNSDLGQIIKGLKNVGVKNPVILLDEVDRVSDDKREEIMGILLELLDPAQNLTFLDYYLDFPFDLSQVLFIATANNTSNIATAVMDRLEPIETPSYSDSEKVAIGKDYLLPKAVVEAGLDSSQVMIDQAAWPQIIRPLGYDGGIRSLSRTLQAIARKCARKIVEGSGGPFQITLDNLGEYIEN